MAVLAGAEAAGGGGAAAGGGAAGGGAAGGGAGAGGAGGGKGLGAKAKKAGALHLAGKALKQHKAKEGKQSSRTTLILLIVFMFLLTPVMVVLLAFSVIAGGCDDQAATSSTGTGTTSGPGSGAISTSGEQKSIDMTSSQQAIARTIVQTVSDLGLPRRAAEISLATALLESTLSANPKPSQLKSPKYSVGLFQQQGPWGPVKFRLDPRKSTILFLVGGVGGVGGQGGLTDVAEWQTQRLEDAAYAVQRPGDPKTPYGEWEDQAVKTASGLWPGAQAQTRMTGIIPNYVLKEVGMGFAFNPGGPLAQGSPIPGTNGVSDDPADTDHDTETTNDGDAANPVAGTPPVAGTAPAPGAAPVATAADCAAGGTSDSTAAAPSGDLVRVPCPAGGGSIQIDTSIASNVTDLLAAAMRDGYPMCGSGYRDHQRQIELRRQHCGTSYYDIYRKSSSSCSPPTAVPGHSMHERGLAIDFTMSNDTGFDWLKAHSQEFGLKNLPSERWHYSTNGN